ncbi:MAG: DUF4919 domain-containing protein, partial [Muribaculaceae bacterium]|nr:DUF4919 domain-containing protein [Muribaculaceae bacterium]
MSRTLSAIIALVVSTIALAQTDLDRIPREKPDFDRIRAEITDRTSPYYYPRLMEEYLRNDTLMKLDKYRRLYLGYTLQEDYNPYRMSPVSNTTQSIGRANLTRLECDTIIK